MRWTKKKLIYFYFVLWLTTFGLILLLMAQRWVFSPLFYDSDNFLSRASKFVDKLNSERYIYARQYLQSFSPEINKDLHTKTLKSAMMVAVIITKRRETCGRHELDCEPHYLQQVIAALDEDMKIFASNGHGHFIPIVICNVDKQWKTHLDFSQVSRRFPTVLLHQNESSSNSNQNLRSQESLDYAMCLESTLKLSNSKYLLVLEDDALSFRGLFEKISYILNFRVEHKMSHDAISESERWGWIKLYCIIQNYGQDLVWKNQKLVN